MKSLLISLFTFKKISSRSEAKNILQCVGNVFFIVGSIVILASIIVRDANDVMLILILFGVMWITLGYVIKNHQSRMAAIISFLFCLYTFYFALMLSENTYITYLSIALRGILLLISYKGVQASIQYHKLNQ